MERREVFKKLGILTLVGVSGVSLLSACANSNKEEVLPIAADKNDKSANSNFVNNWNEDRNKLIINREPQKIKDPENPTKVELKHTPDITFGASDEKGHSIVNVTIGKSGIIHPATKEHWIDYMTLFINDVQYAHTEYINGSIRGYETYYATLAKGDKVRVECGCNLHGIWTNEVVFM